MRKKIFNFIAILIVGGLGGFLADQFFLPYLAEIRPFSELGFIKRAINGTTIINPTEKIFIQENTALEQMIGKAKNKVVAIRSYQKDKVIKEGSGFIVTGDGWIITASELLPEKASSTIFYQGKTFNPIKQKRDPESDLILLKIDSSNLPVVSWADFDKLDLGERIILLAAQINQEEKSTGEINYFVNWGIVRQITAETIRVNLEEDNVLASGSPLVDVKGRVLGLNLVSEKGLKKTVPVTHIKKFLDESF